MLRKTLTVAFASAALFAITACTEENVEVTPTTTVTETPSNEISAEINIPGVDGEVVEENNNGQ